jgi:formylmethanofuran dehydrogenase subunit E
MRLAALLGVALVSCATQHEAAHTHGHVAAPLQGDHSTALDRKLAEVARVHGGAGPWAVAGYRMGEHAVAALGLKRGSFDLEVVHHSPKEVQYACIADGAEAATGASLGKLNLSLSEAPASETRTVYRNKATGATITLRPSAGFAKRFRDVPREKLAEAGRDAMALPDAEVFEIVPQ